MAHVITQACCSDASCVEVCPVDCIRPTPDSPEYCTAEMLYIDPDTCIDCGACVDVCPVDAIFPDDQLLPEHGRYPEINGQYFKKHPLEPAEFEPSTAPTLPPDRLPLRVAVVGSGPAACYAATALIDQAGRSVEVEMFERLPTPWGLVRAGVAPDHPGTKAITDVFRPTVSNPSFQFHLNVEIGEHLTHDELLAHHHAVIYAVGAFHDRRLGVVGEDLPGSHSATEFIAWYNGHPEFADLEFDLSGERAVIVGNGNVALDMARILVSAPEELARTDIADHALAALRKSNIQEVVVLGRRGPAQAACTNPELLALGHLRSVDVLVDAAEAELDEHSRAVTGRPDADPSVVLKTELVREYAQRHATPSNKRIVLRFLTSPTEVLGTDRVTGIALAHNEITLDSDGMPKPRATERTETINAGIVLRAIGSRSTPVPGMPFDTARGTIPNRNGRVVDPESGRALPGAYAAGWIKRGPSGGIGSNKQCASETVALLLEDFAAGRLDHPVRGRGDLNALVHERQPDVVNGLGWNAIDRAERQRGRTSGQPRRKITDVATMIGIAQGVRPPR
ncbi:4Fe-4S binding protein [Saccharopolyspora shandongensis]|uniref:4Fe-4S binding protein n=1 Tax=Saccharopolyspora shandongensis TaxID=418495 RepID=UPI0033DCF211